MSIEVHKWVGAQQIKSMAAKTILSRLAIYANNDYDGNNFYAYPSITTLEKECGCARTTVVRSLKKLIDDGFIEKAAGDIIQGHSNKGQNCYRIIVSEVGNKYSKEVVIGLENSQYASSISCNYKIDNNATSSATLPATSSSVHKASSAALPNSKRKEIKSNYLSKSIVMVSNQHQEHSTEKSYFLNEIGLGRTPEFTKDKTILENPTDFQIEIANNTADECGLNRNKLVNSIFEIYGNRLEYFDDFNQIVVAALIKNLEESIREESFNEKIEKRKYEIDYNAIKLASNERLSELDISQTYAVDHILKYLKKRVGKWFDFDELKQWVIISLKNGYEGLGFQDALRCIVKAIKEDNYTRPYSLRTNYLCDTG